MSHLVIPTVQGLSPTASPFIYTNAQSLSSAPPSSKNRETSGLCPSSCYRRPNSWMQRDSRVETTTREKSPRDTGHTESVEKLSENITCNALHPGPALFCCHSEHKRTEPTKTQPESRRSSSKDFNRYDFIIQTRKLVCIYLADGEDGRESYHIRPCTSFIISICYRHGSALCICTRPDDITVSKVHDCLWMSEWSALMVEYKLYLLIIFRLCIFVVNIWILIPFTWNEVASSNRTTLLKLFFLRCNS